MSKITPAKIWQLLDEVMDPEIPVVSVVEMGMIRSVSIEGGTARVVVTPTFVGCPALDAIQESIRARLRQAGADEVLVTFSLSPPWSSDQITARGREKLRSFGLAPPSRHAGRVDLALLEPVACPFCGSQDTVMKNSFGPTLCRMIYVCKACSQPFELFKPI
jgi:ring-1,2-phenylacetyl-CoA epoxidase subunit PaaD